MLDFSSEVKRLVSTFLTYRNDIDIYTEDEAKDKEFYKALFKKLLNGRMRINDVTPLGSKAEVIDRCKTEPDNGRKKIFIIDGDIKIVHGHDIPQLKNLFVLDAYCVENLLFDKEAITKYIYFSCATKSMDEISQELNFDIWMLGYVDKLIDLFLHFALIDFFGGKFTLYNAHKFHYLENSQFLFSEKIVDQYIDTLKSEISTIITESQYEHQLEIFQSKWKKNIDTLLAIVSGKNYLIPILLIKSQSFKKSKALPTMQEIKLQLVHHSSLVRFEKLKEAIENLK